MQQEEFDAPEVARSTSAHVQHDWRQALEQYFLAIGFMAGFPLHHQVSQNGALFMGQTLYELNSIKQISKDGFEQAAELLYYRSETRFFTLGRMYTLVSLALGYPTYVDARLALIKGAGILSPTQARLGAFALEVFAPQSKRSLGG